MPARYDDDDSDSNASTDSLAGTSDSDDDLPPERPPRRQIPPFGWIFLGFLVAAGAGVGIYFAVRDTGSSGATSASSSPSSAAEEAAPATSAASTSNARSASGHASSGGGRTEEPASKTASSAKPASTGSSSSSSSSSSSLSPLVGSDLLLDFTTCTTCSDSSGLASFLSQAGISISSYQVGSEPVTHTFVTENIDWDADEGALRLKVDGQSSGTDDVKSGEIATDEAWLYGTVTTRAKASPVEGVCHGFFFYADDNHEVDIELLTSFYTEGKGDAVAAGCEFTNQPLEKGGKETNTAVAYGFDPTADYHDYTIEWTSTATTFSIDGKLYATLEENVPTTPMPMLWNSWSSGGPNWSAGPPTEDSYLLIQGLAANWTKAG